MIKLGYYFLLIYFKIFVSYTVYAPFLRNFVIRQEFSIYDQINTTIACTSLDLIIYKKFIRQHNDASIWDIMNFLQANSITINNSSDKSYRAYHSFGFEKFIAQYLP